MRNAEQISAQSQSRRRKKKKKKQTNAKERGKHKNIHDEHGLHGQLRRNAHDGENQSGCENEIESGCESDHETRLELRCCLESLPCCRGEPNQLRPFFQGQFKNAKLMERLRRRNGNTLRGVTSLWRALLK
jgi:hypothetical protein